MAVIEDGGFSFEPFYWFSHAQPIIRGGNTSAEAGDLTFPGHSNTPYGAEIGIPAGPDDTLRISYFRVQGHANSILPQDEYIYGEAYNGGDFINGAYTIQSAKISWDYLSYTWNKAAGPIRFKTLWEVLFVNVGMNAEAPFKEPVTDPTTGNTDYNMAHGTGNAILPTFGVEFEQKLGHHFRWEVKGSGFGVPHHGNIWDADASIYIRMHGLDLIGGGKAFHFETSPQKAEYWKDTIAGPYVGLRYTWGAPE